MYKVQFPPFEILSERCDVVTYFTQEELQVCLSVVCAGCNLRLESQSSNTEKARAKLYRKCKNWRIVFDKTVNNAYEPFCSLCVRKLFQNKMENKKESKK